jgi:hypothetical protein
MLHFRADRRWSSICFPPAEVPTQSINTQPTIIAIGRRLFLVKIDGVSTMRRQDQCGRWRPVTPTTTALPAFDWQKTPSEATATLPAQSSLRLSGESFRRV